MNKRLNKAIGVGIVLLLFVFLNTRVGYALDATSTSFFMRQGIGTLHGRSTSSGFWIFQDDSGEALGISTSSSFKVISGMIRNLFQPVKPAYTQAHYHWRNDDGSEATSTSATGGIEDTALSSINQNTLKRLRLEISNTGGTIKSFSSQQFRLEQGLLSTTCSAISSWVDLSATTGTWAMATTTNLTDGANTTNITTSTGGVSDGNNKFITPNGGVKTTSSQTASISVPSDSFVELEYAIKPLASSTPGGTYCFRLTNAGSATNFSYLQYPQATLSAGAQTISLTVNPTTVALPGLTPGGAVSATSTATVTITGGTSGYSLKISRDSGTSTLASSTIAFPDYTSWNPGTGCSSGQGNGSASPGQNLSFRVRQSGTDSSYCAFWWGTNDTGGVALFAGFPASSQTVVNATSSNDGTTVTTLLYRADAPVTQRATNYIGTITITAITNP